LLLWTILTPMVIQKHKKLYAAKKTDCPQVTSGHHVEERSTVLGNGAGEITSDRLLEVQKPSRIYKHQANLCMSSNLAAVHTDTSDVHQSQRPESLARDEKLGSYVYKESSNNESEPAAPGEQDTETGAQRPICGEHVLVNVQPTKEEIQGTTTSMPNALADILCPEQQGAKRIGHYNQEVRHKVQAINQDVKMQEPHPQEQVNSPFHGISYKAPQLDYSKFDRIANDMLDDEPQSNTLAEGEGFAIAHRVAGVIDDIRNGAKPESKSNPSSKSVPKNAAQDVQASSQKIIPKHRSADQLRAMYSADYNRFKDMVDDEDLDEDRKVPGHRWPWAAPGSREWIHAEEEAAEPLPDIEAEHFRSKYANARERLEALREALETDILEGHGGDDESGESSDELFEDAMSASAGDGDPQSDVALLEKPMPFGLNSMD